MKVRVTIGRRGQELYSGEYTVAAEGDLERAITDAMAKAKAKPGFRIHWDFDIHVSQA